MDSRRIVQIICGQAGDRPDTRGSGYRITATTVLTAAHVIEGATSIRVRCHAGQPGEWTVTGRGETLGDDTALIHVAPAEAMADLPPPTYGALGTRPAVLAAIVVGYPLFQLIQPGDDSGNGSATRPYRDTAQVPGEVAALQGLRSGRLTFHVNATYAPRPSSVPGRSPWEGMSGAAVWVNECLVGVISQDQDPDQPIRLIACRLEHMLAGLTAGQSTRVRADLGLLPGQDLVDAAVDVRSYAILLDHRQEALLRLPVGGVKGRGGELEFMRRFCAGADALLVWLADAWSGKSALMSAFAAEPPGGVDVVSFFINSQIPDQRDSQSFLISVSRQLEALLGLVPGSREPSPGAADGAFWRLLGDAATDSLSRGRALVLLIDGLDEDAALAGASGQRSIASLLSGNLPDGLHIMAATRAYQKVLREIGTDSHPSRAFRDLHPSPYAVVSRGQAAAEIDSATLEEGLGMDLAGFLAAAGSGLTLEDFAGLTGRPPGAIVSMLQASFRRSIRPEPSADRVRKGESAIFVFSHETLPGLVRDGEHLGSRIISQYVDRLHSWAERCRAAGWNEQTPDYLVSGYPALLAATEDLGRLLGYALDTRRHAWLLERLGHDQQSYAEIRAAERLNLGREPVDLLAALNLAIHRADIEGRSTRFPASLLALFAVLGQPARALRIAATVSDPGRRIEAVQAIAVAQSQPGAGEFSHALDTADTIADAGARAETLSRIAQAQVDAGRPDGAATALRKAIDAAGDIARAPDRAEALIKIARVHVAAGTPDGATTPLHQARRTVRSIEDIPTQAETLSRIAEAQAAAGAPEAATTTLRDALDISNAIPFEGKQAQVLAAIARTRVTAGLADDGTLARALALAANLAYPESHALVLSAVAEVYALSGQRDQAESILEDAVAAADVYTARFEEYTRWRSGVTLESIAEMQASCGLDDAARHTVAELIDNRPEFIFSSPEWTLLKIAQIQTAAGRHHQGLITAGCITEPWSQSAALAEIAKDMAVRGLDDDAARCLQKAIAVRVTDPAAKVPLIQVAEAQLAAQHPDLALSSAEEALAISRATPDPAREVAVLTAIAEVQTTAGQLARAADMLTRAAAIAVSITSRWEAPRAMAGIAKAQAAAGLHDRAMSNVGTLTAEPRLQCETLISIAELETAAGQRELAADALDKASAAAHHPQITFDDWLYPKLLTDIALAQASAGQHAQALATASAIYFSWQRSRAVREVALTQARASLHEQARATAKTLGNAQDQVQALVAIARAEASAGQQDAAGITLDEAITVTRTLTEALEVQAGILAEIVQAQASIGWYEEARATAHTITEPTRKAAALATVADAMTTEASGTTPDGIEVPAEPTWREAALAAIAAAESAVGLPGHASAAAGTAATPQQASELRTLALAGCGLDDSSALVRKLIALALASGPWHESLAAAYQVNPVILSRLDDFQQAM